MSSLASRGSLLLSLWGAAFTQSLQAHPAGALLGSPENLTRAAVPPHSLDEEIPWEGCDTTLQVVAVFSSFEAH